MRTYLERDVQDLSSIDNLVDFRRLMQAACLRVGNLVNQTELGRDLRLPQPTVRRWLNLLEISYQLVALPAYSVNRTKRLIKTPKIYWADTGLCLHLSGVTSPGRAHFENQVLSDLLVWRDAHVGRRPELHYWRTTTGEEVDFVIERGSARRRGATGPSMLCVCRFDAILRASPAETAAKTAAEMSALLRKTSGRSPNEKP